MSKSKLPPEPVKFRRLAVYDKNRRDRWEVIRHEGGDDHVQRLIESTRKLHKDGVLR